jgi:hypothetical protein
MLHFLLIILALLAIWKLLSHGRTNGVSLVTGLRRLSLVLAIAGAGLGGLIGYVTTHNCTYPTAANWAATPSCTGPDPGAIALAIIVGLSGWRVRC